MLYKKQKKKKKMCVYRGSGAARAQTATNTRTDTREIPGNPPPEFNRKAPVHQNAEF